MKARKDMKKYLPTGKADEGKSLLESFLVLVFFMLLVITAVAFLLFSPYYGLPFH